MEMSYTYFLMFFFLLLKIMFRLYHNLSIAEMEIHLCFFLLFIIDMIIYVSNFSRIFLRSTFKSYYTRIFFSNYFSNPLEAAKTTAPCVSCMRPASNFKYPLSSVYGCLARACCCTTIFFYDTYILMKKTAWKNNDRKFLRKRFISPRLCTIRYVLLETFI